MAERRDTRRRFEQWAQNPACGANTLSAVHGIEMKAVAESEGLPPSMGQSPFAIVRGRTFERVLFENEAARLREELVKGSVLPADAAGFRDLRLRMVGGQCSSLDEALEATLALFRQISDARTEEDLRAIPSIVAGATVRIPGAVMLPEAILVLDVLVVRSAAGRLELVVGEIKTYPDRAGYTDGTELAGARAQAGVYAQGLEDVLQELGFRDGIRVCRGGFLVLSRPGFNQPSLRPDEDLKYQIARARRGFDRLRAAARQVVPLEPDEDRYAVVRAAPTAYSSACLSFCDRAPGCYRRAWERGDPVVLGEEVARFLGSVELERAAALLDGATPATEAEADLNRRISKVRSLVGLA